MKIKKLLVLILGLSLCMAHLPSSAYYVHANGPSNACANSEVTYTYSDDMIQGTLTWTITKGQIFNIFSQTWVSSWAIDQSSNPTLNDSYPFHVRFDPIPFGATGYTANVKVEIFKIFAVEGNKLVALEPSPGVPIINGQTSLLNCIGQQQSYTPVSLPPNWNLTGWTMTSNLQQLGSSTNPITVKAANTTYSGQETLTGQFQFSTGGVSCGTKSVN